MTERYTSQELFPPKSQRMKLQHAPAEDYIDIVLQAIMQQTTGKITQEFSRRYNRAKGRIPVRRLLECVDYKDAWERHKKAFEMTMILEHNDQVRHTGVGEIIDLQLPDPIPESRSTVEGV